MAASSRAQVLDLYRVMLRESGRFTSYNYRTYAIRRIREAFRENKNVKDSAQIQMLLNKAKRNLEIIRRQVPWYSWMSQLHPTLLGQHSLLSTILKSTVTIDLFWRGPVDGVLDLEFEDSFS
ncbi:LYR motif-containing protein 4 isoform X1 [Macrotis lagotis]|uniref:LYR motif-containing protein 4 isoform X1 n=2 Tax=Macrotis lagotis TaxID=92651 RepID=UPI003D683636